MFERLTQHFGFWERFVYTESEFSCADFVKFVQFQPIISIKHRIPHNNIICLLLTVNLNHRKNMLQYRILKSFIFKISKILWKKFIKPFEFLTWYRFHYEFVCLIDNVFSFLRKWLSWYSLESFEGGDVDCYLKCLHEFMGVYLEYFCH